MIEADGTANGPAQRRVEYLCVNSAGDVSILVTTDGNYRNFRMYVGSPGTPMREVKVFDAERMRDGGTTWIFTAEGTFFAPSPHRKPSWGPGSDASCVWPTADLMGDEWGLPTPDAFRPALPLAKQESFKLVEPATYADVGSASDDRVLIERAQAALARR
ncbi:hypothetical protein H7J87_12430 [Mycolicibacterium wolinskyi]|uniref:Uncharacterized protein n=1 Tax=Mycolicibacterium wolinskyi TaxID=59750 RepID=A0A1X2FJF7_9MYCO|nr:MULTISPECIES: hypothetical protein [Mycolicibacterium]MCV7286135.1 hypothetical protein [Mycolicibacterium wolinskyi]MCV7296331.1 hypothetical protein [Mycolicibacterium goodii]ORX18552.1 hypothetical protein AWC31_14750 [Mycolicibacterium wolinskyi]